MNYFIVIRALELPDGFVLVTLENDYVACEQTQLIVTGTPEDYPPGRRVMLQLTLL